LPVKPPLENITSIKGKEIMPGLEFAPASTQGFPLLALFFDSFHQTLAAFRYLGRQQLDRREMYVVAFAQRPDAARLIGQIYIGGKLSSTGWRTQSCLRLSVGFNLTPCQKHPAEKALLHRK
jgi:hypothetical protein